MLGLQKFLIWCGIIQPPPPPPPYVSPLPQHVQEFLLNYMERS